MIRKQTIVCGQCSYFKVDSSKVWSLHCKKFHKFLPTEFAMDNFAETMKCQPNKTAYPADEITKKSRAFIESVAIDKIQAIRTKNNRAWMNLLRLAMRDAPEEAKKIMSEITENDRQINELMKGLVK